MSDRQPPREFAHHPDKGAAAGGRALDGFARGAYGHDIETCDKPICQETMRIIRARGRRQVVPK